MTLLTPSLDESPHPARATFVRIPEVALSLDSDETQSLAAALVQRALGLPETLTIRELLTELSTPTDADAVLDSRAGQLETRMRTRREKELIEELHRRQPIPLNE